MHALEMINIARRLPAELLFTLCMIAGMLFLSTAFHLPISLPSGSKAAFVGIHYLYPLLGVAIWCIVAALGQRRRIASTFLIALPCYAVVLLCHFNIKLWAHHINPLLYDTLYWHIDQALWPLVDFCMMARRAIAVLIPLDSNFYMLGFIAMFYGSFCYHAVFTPSRFRELFLAALLFQGLGAVSYLIFPALGPFIYERGLDAAATQAQEGMMHSYLAAQATGRAWFITQGSAQLTAGLAAMPSLHSGGAFLFLMFAWRHGKVLVPIYALIFGFILIAAVATRWHYVIDIPAGIALGWLSLRIANLLARPRSDRAVTGGTTLPAHA